MDFSTLLRFLEKEARLPQARDFLHSSAVLRSLNLYRLRWCRTRLSWFRNSSVRASFQDQMISSGSLQEAGKFPVSD